MPYRNAAKALVALAALGLSTGCEKQSPYITLTAHGVVVKARAAEYCRGEKCTEGGEQPTIFVQPGDVLGIDVPRSVAEDGWRIGGNGDFSHDHYRAIPIGGEFQSGAQLPLQIVRNDANGRGSWRFLVAVR